jgi:hypothetical protein
MDSMPVQEMPPVEYAAPDDLPDHIKYRRDVTKQIEQMIKDEDDARKKGMT